MADTAQTGQWTPARMMDVAAGNLIRKHAGAPWRTVEMRNHPPVVDPTMHLIYAGGGGETLAKLSPVEIYDPDGMVAARVAMNAGRL
jgi:hypothetical protein